MAEILPLTALDPSRFDRPKRLTAASRQLAELKGVAASMPNQGILISTLGRQEAKDSSAIENIVTTHDELFRDAAFPEAGSARPKKLPATAMRSESASRRSRAQAC
jgi:Fic family protein